MRVKICGVTTFGDALNAARAGADLLGLNFYPPSPRYLTPFEAEDLTLALRGALGDACPLLAGVFVNEAPEDILTVVETVGLDAVQLSGDEPPETLAALKGIAYQSIRPQSHDEALRLADAYLPHAPTSEDMPTLLLDAWHPALYGGSGETASVAVARALVERTPRLMLAGGLTPGNVAGRVADISPWGVDVASGVEGVVKGRKDVEKMRAFVEAARGML